MKLRFIAFISAFFLFATSHIANSNPIDITSLTLEELMEIEITTASKISQKKEDVPAAVSVITQEDIRRSGATNIADILRMVPGVNVAKINPSAYGVSIRGFNDLFANKLLVLLDGKTVYNPIFSGVFWERIDTILEDIDRIEVIRGPGASIWGANAVNGIVNIITKDSKDTKGFLGSFSSGTEDRHILQLRYGDSIGSNGSYRIYFKNREVDDSGDIRVGFPVSHEIDEVDDWRMLKGGFRLDIEPNAKDKFTLQGDADRYERRKAGDLTAFC